MLSKQVARIVCPMSFRRLDGRVLVQLTTGTFGECSASVKKPIAWPTNALERALVLDVELRQQRLYFLPLSRNGRCRFVPISLGSSCSTALKAYHRTRAYSESVAAPGHIDHRMNKIIYVHAHEHSSE